MITIELFGKLIKSVVEGSMADGVKDLCKEIAQSKGKTLEEQLFFCIDKSLMKLSEDYGFEYDLKVHNTLFEQLLKSSNTFSRDILEKIVEQSLDLSLDEEFYQKWIVVINKVISENELFVIRDFILLQQSNRREETVFPRLLTAKPALPPEQYVNREEEQAIIDRLKVNKKMVLVNGIGGIGKSAVCRTIFHKFIKENNRTLAWIVYNGGSLLDDIKKQIYYPRNGKQWNREFEKFIEQDIDEDAVIFIDNLDVTEDEDEYLPRLANAKCNIICTSRVERFSHFEIVPIEYLDEEKCIEIFMNYYGQKQCNIEIVRQIITKAGRHTLVIEILAKIGKAEHYSVQELYEKLEKEGFDLDGIVSVKNKEDTLVGHLLRTFNIKALNHTQKKILGCMAILPSQWIPYKLREWLGLPNSYNIMYLVAHAWIVESELGYYMHPVIKEVVKRGIEISQDTLIELISGISKDIDYQDNIDAEKSRDIISFAEAILKEVKIKNQVVSLIKYNISMIYAQLGEYDVAEEYIEQCINIEEEQHNSMDLLASAHNHYGYICYYKFMDSDAEREYKIAYDLRKKIGKIRQIAETTSNLALLYQGMWSCNKQNVSYQKYLKLAKKYQIEAIKEFEHIFHGKPQLKLASAYNNMAVINHSLCDYEGAVYYYRKAEKIRIQLRDKVYSGDLSITYKGLCECFMDMAARNINERNMRICNKIALLYIEDAIQIRKEDIRRGNIKLDINQLLKIKKNLYSLIDDSAG